MMRKGRIETVLIRGSFSMDAYIILPIQTVDDDTALELLATVACSGSAEL